MRSSSSAEYVAYVTARLPALHRAAFLLCGGDADRADDIVQSTITRLYQPQRVGGGPAYAAGPPASRPGAAVPPRSAGRGSRRDSWLLRGNRQKSDIARPRRPP